MFLQKIFINTQKFDNTWQDFDNTRKDFDGTMLDLDSVVQVVILPEKILLESGKNLIRPRKILLIT